MKSLNRSLLLEMGLILAVASAIGLLWNHKVLRDVFSGKPVQAQPAQQPQAQAATPAAPLPVGLMQVKQLFDEKQAVFVDARDIKAYTAGHIKGAIAMPLVDYESALKRLKDGTKPDAAIVAYCNGFDCHDSMTLGEKLIQAGYTNVYVFLGGYPEWKDAGYAVEGDQP